MRTPSLPLAVVLLLPVVAGCLQEDLDASAVLDDLLDFGGAAIDATLPTPAFLCHDGTRCNFEMTPDEGRHGNEVTIAVNPTDPRNVVGVAKDYYEPDAGDCVWDGIYVTHDGGVTPYEDRSFDGSPWRQMNEPDPEKVNYATQFWCTTDPVVYFDVNGRLYYLLMAYQADPVTGSKTCEDVCPPIPGLSPGGALNDWAFNRATQIIAVSDDGGDTFHTFTPLFEGSYPVAFNDKGWVSASDDGTIHVGWSLFPHGNVYFRSTDGGATYQGPTLVSGAIVDSPVGAAWGFGSYVNVGPGPEVYYSWASTSPGGLPAAGFARSLDYGETWEPSVYAFEYEPFDIPNGLSPRDRRGLYQWPVMAVDREPDSPFAGAVYFAYPDGTDDGSDIRLRASFDQGETWTEPVKLNDDGPGSYQFMPAISVSPGGVVDVTWFDQRLDADQYLLDQYYTYSLDGGRTWAPNFRVRDTSDLGWDPALSKHQNGMVYLGDYIGISSSWEAAHPVWPDGRSGEVSDVYTATLKRPMFAEGYSEELKAGVLEWVAAHPLSG